MLCLACKIFSWYVIIIFVAVCSNRVSTKTTIFRVKIVYKNVLRKSSVLFSVCYLNFLRIFQKMFAYFVKNFLYFSKIFFKELSLFRKWKRKGLYIFLTELIKYIFHLLQHEYEMPLKLNFLSVFVFWPTLCPGLRNQRLADRRAWSCCSSPTTGWRPSPTTSLTSSSTYSASPYPTTG